MSIATDTQHPHTIDFDNLNWVAGDPLPLINTIDPITGRDIGDVSGHPSIVDGNLTIYFESEKSRKTYQEMPINHPCSRSTGKPSADMDRGG